MDARSDKRTQSLAQDRCNSPLIRPPIAQRARTQAVTSQCGRLEETVLFSNFGCTQVHAQ